MAYRRRDGTNMLFGGIFGGVGLLLILIAIVLVVLGLGNDDPGHSYSCGSSTRNGTCYSGAAGDYVGAAITGGIGVIFFGIGAPFYLAYVRTNRRAKAALASGLTCQGMLVETQPTGTRVNGRTVYKVRAMGKTPNGDVVQCTEKLKGSLPQGTQVTLAYDNNGNVCVVEDLQQLHDERAFNVGNAGIRMFEGMAMDLGPNIPGGPPAAYAPRQGSIRVSQSPSYTPPQPGDRTKQMEQLEQLRASGALTEAEFHAARQRLLTD